MRLKEFELKREEIESKERTRLAEIQMNLEMDRRNECRRGETNKYFFLV